MSQHVFLGNHYVAKMYTWVTAAVLLVHVTCISASQYCIYTFSFISDVQFRFMNGEIVNHGLVTIDDITEDEALLCVTNRIDCCPPEESNVSNGQWYFPDGTIVQDDSENSFYQTSIFAAVRLHHTNGGMNGIYQCVMPDAVGNVQTLYIGIYDSGAGKLVFREVNSHFLKVYFFLSMTITHYNWQMVNLIPLLFGAGHRILCQVSHYLSSC